MYTNKELERNGFHPLQPGTDEVEQMYADEEDNSEENEDNKSRA